MTLYLDNEIKSFFTATEPLFDQLMTLRGEQYRYQKGRLTQRITLGNKTYFIKQHAGVGWMEIIKNVVQLRLPVISAKNEWNALQKLQSLGVAVPRVIAHGCRGANPATLRSFVLLEDLTATISLEELCKTWRQTPPNFSFKLSIIKEVARIARLLHENGINHRDFYICHFLLDRKQQQTKLYLIDLHRAQMRRTTPKRWLIKDLAGLYFSSMDIGLTQRDLYRFMQYYRQKSLRAILDRETAIWQKVKVRGEQLYCEHDN